MRNLIRISVIACLAASAIASVHAATLYKSVKTPPGGAQELIVGFNNSTQILVLRGNPTGQRQTVLEDWSGGANNYRETVLTIPTSNSYFEPSAFNDALQMVGFGNFNGSPKQAFFYSDGVFYPLAMDLAGAGIGSSDRSTSITTAINNQGEAIGHWDGSQGGPIIRKWFLHSHGAVSELKGFTADPNAAVDLIRINSLGQILGSVHAPQNASTHPFLYDHGVTTNLTQDPLSNSAVPLDLNDRGEVLLETIPYGADESHLPCLIYRNGELIDLNAWMNQPTRVFCQPYKLNNQGSVVGYAEGDAPSQTFRGPFIYRDGKMTNLNELIDPSDDLARNKITLTTAIFINDKDEIIATAGNGANYLLTPIATSDAPPPPTPTPAPAPTPAPSPAPAPTPTPTPPPTPGAVPPSSSPAPTPAPAQAPSPAQTPAPAPTTTTTPAPTPPTPTPATAPATSPAAGDPPAMSSKSGGGAFDALFLSVLGAWSLRRRVRR